MANRIQKRKKIDDEDNDYSAKSSLNNSKKSPYTYSKGDARNGSKLPISNIDPSYSTPKEYRSLFVGMRISIFYSNYLFK